MRIITPEDLVLYLYNETPPQKMRAIKASLASDWSLQEAFEQIISAKEQLEKLDHSPREEAIKNIFSYASKKVRHSHSH